MSILASHSTKSGLFGGRASYRSGAGDIQDEPGVSCHSRQQGRRVSKTTRVISAGLTSQSKKLPRPKTGQLVFQ